MSPKARLYTLSIALVGALAACADGPPTGLADGPDEPQFAKGGQAKLDVCHVSQGNGHVRLISIAEPALAAHLAHGDTQPGDAVPGEGLVGSDCGVLQVGLDPATTYATALFGGAGGAEFIDVCPAGSVAVGADGIGVTYIGIATMYNFSLHCRVLNVDGTLGAATSVGGRGTGLGTFNAAPFGGDCASDGMLVSASGTTAPFFVTSFQGGCGSLSRLVDALGGEDATIGPFAGTGFSNNVPYGEACNPGYAITGLISHAGDILDAFAFLCTQVTLS